PQGVQLAPFYDLMSTTIYSGLSKRFAFQVGGADQPGSIGQSDLASLAKALGFKPAYFIRQGVELAEALVTCLPDVAGGLETVAKPGTEQVLLERLCQRITRNCHKMPRRWQAT
ncbi:MAG: type II toxin-antitoxin system HipA family toxin, partial [Halomonas sp.]|nr:type II toxin-antitoxin system HipA family toxin [Halomonas sp.]